MLAGLDTEFGRVLYLATPLYNPCPFQDRDLTETWTRSKKKRKNEETLKKKTNIKKNEEEGTHEKENASKKTHETKTNEEQYEEIRTNNHIKKIQSDGKETIT